MICQLNCESSQCDEAMWIDVLTWKTDDCKEE